MDSHNGYASTKRYQDKAMKKYYIAFQMQSDKVIIDYLEVQTNKIEYLQKGIMTPMKNGRRR